MFNGEKILGVCCIFYSVTIIPNGYAYVKSFGIALTVVTRFVNGAVL